tara:strand:+ start:1092 stop:1757 length:666 start_codon:yes stop_codon:yes gene_type:complete
MANFFSPSINSAPWKIAVIVFVVVATLAAAVTYYWSPNWSRVGYTPTQPVAYNHYLHVEQLGLDCRYCHTHVDESGHANVPDAGTCMNCHSNVRSPVINPDSPKIAPIRASFEGGDPVEWVRIHSVPDYVYFNHAVHVNRGVSCVECHGNVNEAVVVGHEKSLSMAFCLDCHRNPEEHVRPVDEVFNLNWTPEDASADWDPHAAVVNWNINPPQSCSGCHR